MQAIPQKLIRRILQPASSESFDKPLRISYLNSQVKAVPLLHGILNTIKPTNMNLLGNIIWLIFGGLLVFLEYMVAGFILCLTIVGIPFGLQCFKIGILSLMPFGREVRDVPGSTGVLATLFNIIWILVGGIWIAITHLFFGILLAITIIGLPFARQHFKLMSLSFTPFGKEVV